MKTKVTLILLLLLLLLTGGEAFAQVQLNAPSSYQPVSLAQGGAPGTYKVDIVNNNSTILNATFSLALPVGMEYVAGTITGANQLNVADLQNPTFTLNNVPIGNTLQITFNARINCGFTTPTINYSVISGGTTVATGSSGVAGNTPAPAYAFTDLPTPQVLTAALNTNGTRTLKFKNSGVVPVTAVYVESTVTTASQATSYKIVSANNGTVSSITNGYRIALTGAALQNAITTSVGGANTSFDPGEEITIVLTEQILSCATGSSIPLNIKVGSGDTKGNLCFFDGSTASIATAVGNSSISITRITGTTFPDFCNNGKVSYTIKNEGTGTSSSLYNVKFPWSMNYANSSLAPIVEPEGIVIRKILLNGNDITSLVLTRNGTGSESLIPGLPNCWVINLAGLTSAFGTSLQNLNEDGKFDDLLAGQSFQLDFEYGLNTAAYQTCTINSLPLPNTSSNYFSIGTSFVDQCGTRTNRSNYPFGTLSNYTAPVFQVGGQQYNSFSASLDKAALYPGDKVKLSTVSSGTFVGAFQQAGKILKTFTIILPDGLDYDSTQSLKINNSYTVPVTAINYNAATKTLIITPASNFPSINNSNDYIEIPLVVSGTGTITNKNIQYSSTFAFTGCDVVMPYGCNSQTLTYSVIDGSCATVGTTAFDMTRATFGYVPASSNTNVWYMPTAYVDENTPGINLHGAVSKDKVKTTFKGVVNSTNFTELWARVKYTSNFTSNVSNFDKISANVNDIAGTITITKASDGNTISGNITVGEIVFTDDNVNNLQIQQVNLGAKIGAGKDINYTLQVGDQITVNWLTKVSRDNLSYTFSQIANLEGDLYTKDAGGVTSDCQPIPVGFSIQRLNMAINNNSSVQVVVGLNSLRVMASVLNGNAATDIPGDHFPNEVRTYGNLRSVKATLPGIWILDTSIGKEPTYGTSTQIAAYKFDPSLLSVTYTGGNTVVTFNNVAFGSNGMPLPTANLPVIADWVGQLGNTGFRFYMLPVCATVGPITTVISHNFDLYTTEADGSNTESPSSTYNYGNSNTVYYNYKASAVPTLQNVDGILSAVNWQVKVTNTSDTASIVAAGGEAELPNNWISFVSPNNNITVTKVTDVGTGTVYPVLNYGTGKYWIKVDKIATSATFDVQASYTTCTDDKLKVTYSFGAIGYPDNPDNVLEASVNTCAAAQTKFDLNLYPKDVNLSMTVTSPQNPVQFCTNVTEGEHLIDYTATIANTAVGSAEGLIFEAVFPEGYIARAGTSKITYNGTTKTLGEPVFNNSRGTWEWNISTDPNGITFLPGAASGANSFIFTYQGETSCGFVSGSAVSYNMRSTSGCGKVIEYSAAGTAMELSMKPSSLNTYYLAQDVVYLKNDGSTAPYQIEVTNQGSQPLSPGESIYVTLPKAIDYVAGSIVRIAGATNVGEPISNTILGNSRILKFPLPTGTVDTSTLQQNETAKFSIGLKIVDAAPIKCGVSADTIKLEAIYSVANVTCGATPCDVSVITGSAKSSIDVTKTAFTITPTGAIAKYASTADNNVTVKYTVTNSGTINNSTAIAVDFFNDLNSDGLYTGTEPVLYTQTISGTAANLAVNGVSAEQTAVFTAPESAVCNIVAAIRLINNSQVCADTSVKIDPDYQSAVDTFAVCAGFPVTVGFASNGATVSWSPTTYLSDASISNPVFNYTGTTLTVPTDFVFTATIMHPGGCQDTFTNTVTVNPLPLATIAYPNASYCNRGTAAVTQTGTTGGTYSGDAGLVINSSTGVIDLAASTIGNHDVIYTFTDGSCQNTANTIIRINATTLPGTLSDFTAQCSATLAAPTLTDPCAGLIAATTTTEFPITVQGPTVVTWTFNYGDGYTRTATQNVILKDITPPAVPVLDEITDQCSVTPDAPTTIDNCTGTVTGTTTTVFPITVQGATLIEWTFDDGNGNISKATQNVLIQDVTVPVVPVLADVTTKCPITVTAPTTTDNCSGIVTGTTSTVFPITAKGVTNVTWTFDDGNGNTSTAVQKVTYLDITATLNGTTTVCQNAPAPNVIFTGAGGTAPYTFTYKINGGADQTVTTTNGDSVTVAIPTGTVGTYTYSLVSVRDVDADCENPQVDTATISVNPLPAATITGTTSVCQNAVADVTFTGANGTAPYTFIYKINNGADLTVVTASGSSVDVPVTTSAAGNFVYTLVSVTDSSGTACTQLQTGSATVTVNELPTATISAPAVICKNATANVTFTGANGTAPYTFTYKVNNGADQTVSTASGNSVDVPVTTTALGSFTYTLVSVKDNSAAACTQLQTGAATVTINENAGASISGTAAVCKDAAKPNVTFTGSGGTAPYTFTYNIDGGANQTIVSTGDTATIAVETSTVGTITYNLVSVIDSSVTGCGQSQTGSAVITINPLPTASIAGTTAICQNAVKPAITFTGANGTAPYTFTYKVNGGSDQTVTTTVGNSVIVEAETTASGTFTYDLVSVKDNSASACEQIQTGSATVTVNELPTAAITGTTAVCKNAVAPVVTFTGTGGTAPYTFTYKVNNGADQIVTTIVGNSVDVTVPTGTAGIFTYDLLSIKDNNGTACTQEQTGSAVITINPLPTATIAGTVAVCKDSTAPSVTFTGADGTAPYTFTYKLNNGTEQAVTTISGSSVTVTAPTNATGVFTYDLVSVKDSSSTACEQAQTGSAVVTVNDLLSQSGVESTLCAADGTGYVLTFSVTGTAPYTVTGTGAPGTWNGNQWTSDKILAGTDYNVSVQDANACNIVTVADIAPVCCVYQVTVPTFPVAIVTCYSEIPTQTTLTEAEYEALGNGDGNIGDIPCGIIEITALNSVDPGCNGEVTRTYTVTEYADTNNNKVRDAGEDTVLHSTSVAQIFTIEKTDFVMPANAGITVNCSSDVVAPVVPVVVDNCGNVLKPSAPVISTVPSCNGIESYTYTFIDCAGHSHDWVYTYTINNTIAPQGTVPGNLTVQCIDDIPVANTRAVINVTGNCNDSVSVTVSDTNNGGSGCIANPYILTRTYTLTDCGGLTTQLVQTITAVDTTAPVFVEALPSNITIECTDSIPAAPILTATDNCSAATVTYNEVKNNGNCSGNYQLQRTWTAVDACGNSAVHTQTINVVDTKAPVFVETLPEKEVYANCTTIPEAVILTATDECSNATVSFNEERIDGSCSGKYKLVRTWTAIDDCGNQNSTTQIVDVSCLNIFNAISPNGDGINDTFEIGGIDCFPNNSVKIYNRYGVLVYEKNGYDNVTNPFAGISDGRATILKGDKLPTGTYFYTLEYDDNGEQVQKSGYIYLNVNN